MTTKHVQTIIARVDRIAKALLGEWGGSLAGLLIWLAIPLDHSSCLLIFVKSKEKEIHEKDEGRESER